MSTQEEWLQQQMDLYQGSGSGTLAEQAQRADVLDDWQGLLAGIPPGPETFLPLGDLGGSVLTDPFQSTTQGNSSGWFGVIQQGLSLAGQLMQGGGGVPMAPSALQGTLETFGQNPMQMSTNVRANCWTDFVNNPAKQARAFVRRRVRFRRRPDGSIEMIQSCAPRRMNPLNPRALARAGRRVASFTRIAQGMQKMLERACRKGSRGRRVSYGRAPARRSCR